MCGGKKVVDRGGGGDFMLTAYVTAYVMRVVDLRTWHAGQAQPIRQQLCVEHTDF